MLGRVAGLVLGLGLMGLAIAVLQPAGLEGRLPPIELSAFESVRTGVALALGLLGVSLALAALVRRGQTVARAERSEPVIFRFEPDDEAQTFAPDQEPPAPEPAFPLAEFDPPALAPVPAPEAPFPLLDAPADPEPTTEEEPVIAPAPPPSEPAAELAGAPPIDPFEAARERLHVAARAQDWPAAATALQEAGRLADDDRRHRLAAQDAGDFARAQGRIDDAVEAYDQALAYARLEGETDALSDALINVGDMACEEHRLDAAVAAYEEAVALRRDLAGADGGAEARRRLALALERLADVREDRGHRMRALDLYRESAGLMAGLEQEAPDRFAADAADTRGRLAELEARVLA